MPGQRKSDPRTPFRPRVKTSLSRQTQLHLPCLLWPHQEPNTGTPLWPVPPSHREGPWVTSEPHDDPVSQVLRARSPGNTRLCSANVTQTGQHFPVGQSVRAPGWGVSFTVGCGESQSGQAHQPWEETRGHPQLQGDPCLLRLPAFGE